MQITMPSENILWSKNVRRLIKHSLVQFSVFVFKLLLSQKNFGSRLLHYFTDCIFVDLWTYKISYWIKTMGYWDNVQNPHNKPKPTCVLWPGSAGQWFIVVSCSGGHTVPWNTWVQSTMPMVNTHSRLWAMQISMK